MEKDVSQDRYAAVEMIRHSGQQGVPVIKLDGQYVVGFNRLQLEAILRARNAQPASESARPALGIDVADATRHAPAGSPAGAFVGQVKPGSAAAQAGIQVGDVITTLASQPVRNAEDVSRILASLSPDQPLQAEVYRNGMRRTLRIQ